MVKISLNFVAFSEYMNFNEKKYIYCRFAFNGTVGQSNHESSVDDFLFGFFYHGLAIFRNYIPVVKSQCLAFVFNLEVEKKN